jgi:hypothetical protein
MIVKFHQVDHEATEKIQKIYPHRSFAAYRNPDFDTKVTFHCYNMVLEQNVCVLLWLRVMYEYEFMCSHLFTFRLPLDQAFSQFSHGGCPTLGPSIHNAEQSRLITVAGLS